jgi:TolA-binding protein
MRYPSCQKFIDLWDNYRDGNLSDEEHLWVECHLEGCPECQDLFDIHQSLEASIREMEVSPLTRRRIAIAAANSRRPAKRTFTLSTKTLLPVGGLLALSALLILVFATQGPAKAPLRRTVDSVVAAVPTEPPLPPTPSVDEMQHAVFLGDGRSFIELFPGTALWFDESSELELNELRPTVSRVTLKRGRIIAEVGAHEFDFRFIISTQHAEFEARGTVFSVSIESDGEPQTRVMEGLVEARRKGHTDLLGAGEQLDVKGDSFVKTKAEASALESDLCVLIGCKVPIFVSKPRAANQPSKKQRVETALKEERLDEASRLLKQFHSQDPGHPETVDLLAELARAYRRAKMYSEAERVYLRLIQSFPRSEIALDSLVAVGQLEYRTLRKPSQALVHFDKYIERRPSGFLTETARAEQVRVLQLMGEHGRVVEAAEKYIELHPNGFNLSEIFRRKADALARLNRCEEAVRTYRQIISKWPSSKEAKRAKRGIDSCN